VCKVNFAAVVNEKTPHDRSTDSRYGYTDAVISESSHIAPLDTPSTVRHNYIYEV